MISKELLSEILDEDILRFSVDDSEIIYIVRYDNTDSFINIYELAHKCKEWAHKEGYNLSTKLYDNTHYAKVYKDNQANYFSVEYEPAISDVKAVFKACEWILKEQDVN